MSSWIIFRQFFHYVCLVMCSLGLSSHHQVVTSLGLSGFSVFSCLILCSIWEMLGAQDVALAWWRKTCGSEITISSLPSLPSVLSGPVLSLAWVVFLAQCHFCLGHVLCWSMRVLLRKEHSYTEVIELVSFCPDLRWSLSIVCYFITAPMTHAIFLPGHFPAQSFSF